MAAATMFYGGLDCRSNRTSPFVIVILAVERLTYELESLIDVTPAECNRFELTNIALS